jgi:phage gp45-like
MNRNSLGEMAGRVFHQFVRGTLNKANVDSMLAELHIDGMNSDGRERVEQFQNFGFSASPLPRDEQDQQQQQGSAPGGIGEAMKGPAAEMILAFIGGQRNHPVCIALDDRRHRPLGLKPGENAQYDDQGQMTLLRRGGLFLLSLDTQTTGKDGKTTTTERMVSLRHVEKKKQDRGKVGQAGDSGSSSSGASGSVGAQAAAGGQTQSHQDFKHEGETVNTEVRCTKNRIEFRAGDKVVGYYDVKEDTWFFTGKLIHNQATSEVKDEAPKISHN